MLANWGDYSTYVLNIYPDLITTKQKAERNEIKSSLDSQISKKASLYI